MTWGEQNTQDEGFEQMDYALGQGVNFLDTAELYPVPHNPKTYRDTERIIGNWFKARNNRDQVVLATKMTGYAPFTQHIRPRGFTNPELTKALEGSLSRLNTDYIDLYQLHWPERATNFFGQLDYPYTEQWEDNFLEVLTQLNTFIKDGKIRHIGLSNETAWGTMRTIQLAKENGLEPFVSIQNPYSLLNRTFEVAMSEVCHYEDIQLLAYSPLAFGRLTGKYNDGTATDFSRLNQFEGFIRYNGERSLHATEQYIAIASEFGITPTQLALAFVNTRPFVYSNIIGATSMAQLKENIGSIDIAFTPEMEKAVNAVHLNNPNPAP